MYQHEISVLPTEDGQPINQNSPQLYRGKYKFDSNILKHIISTPICTSGKHRLEMQQDRKSKILSLFSFPNVLSSNILD